VGGGVAWAGREGEKERAQAIRQLCEFKQKSFLNSHKLM